MKTNSTDRRKGIFHIPLVSINYALGQQRAKHPLKHDFLLTRTLYKNYMLKVPKMTM